jgi:hypothetical protein
MLENDEEKIEELFSIPWLRFKLQPTRLQPKVLPTQPLSLSPPAFSYLSSTDYHIY